MFRIMVLTMLLLAAGSTLAFTEQQFESDVFKTPAGDLTITFIGHGSLKFTFAGKNIYIDPYGKLADYGKLPKADLIVITHEHQDHLDPETIEKIRTAKTQFVVSGSAAIQVPGGIVLKNGESHMQDNVTIEAVPAYNLVHTRDNGEPFHPKGAGNGYIFTFGDKRVYVAGDTENIPEMKNITNIDIAFLPMNLPYTMTPDMAADAARMIQPRILYPYHYGDTNPQKLVKLMKEQKGIEIRIRKMK